jgi:hypothetical protein
MAGKNVLAGGALRRAGAVFLMILFSGICLSAQDKPLGDIAREARAEKSQAPHAAKVLTDDDIGGGAAVAPVNPKDDPVVVLNKARIGVLHDTNHTCVLESTGNSGPGWNDRRTVEVSGAGRLHITLRSKSPTNDPSEYLIVENQVFDRRPGGPRERADAKAVGDAKSLAEIEQAALLPQVFKFGFSSGDLKFLGGQTLGVTPTLRYQYQGHVYNMDRTIDIWIGADDGLPRKTEMLTVTRDTITATVRWSESFSCTYGGNDVIKAPM